MEGTGDLNKIKISELVRINASLEELWEKWGESIEMSLLRGLAVNDTREMVWGLEKVVGYIPVMQNIIKLKY